MQKQKSQVRQYLNGNGLLTPLQASLCPPHTNSAPGMCSSYSNPSPVHSSQVCGHSHNVYSIAPSPSPDAHAMSPALSSGATSTSEVSTSASFFSAHYSDLLVGV